RDVALNRDLYLALDEEDRSLWCAARPAGVADLDVALYRSSGTNEFDIPKADIQISANLRGASVSLESHRLTQVEGMMRIGRGCIDVDELRGFDGPTAMRLNGRIATRGVQRADLRVEAADLPVARAGSALNGAETPDGTGVRFDGSVDVWGQVTRVLDAPA